MAEVGVPKNIKKKERIGCAAKRLRMSYEVFRVIFHLYKKPEFKDKTCIPGDIKHFMNYMVNRIFT